MEFVHFLSSHMLNPAQGGRALYLRWCSRP